MADIIRCQPFFFDDIINQFKAWKEAPSRKPILLKEDIQSPLSHVSFYVEPPI